ncbi:hypothetical protein KAH39_00240 [Alcaligenes faecalis]|uniref:hypothetical protein n=1 Tax=Alcaligenes faecalis TaxID=511 RepID=UPI001B378A05|nr:hypothetical protein [Alcaligenes faecalis]MBQ0215728.1 hypothetical protein [Alcaligenes faecalis]
MTQPPVGQQERRHGREKGKLRRHRQTVMDGWLGKLEISRPIGSEALRGSSECDDRAT